MRLIQMLAGMAMLLGACAAPQPVFDTKYDPEQDFSAYRTFAWARDEPMDVTGLLGPTPQTAEKLLQSIRNNLESKGFSYLDDRAAADFWVQFTVGARDGVEIWNVPNSFDDGWWGRPFYGSRQVAEQYTEGELAIDIIDGARQVPVWHGSASRRLTREDLSNPDPDVQPVVDEVLSTFPPG